jgi:hypothetical protein
LHNDLAATSHDDGSASFVAGLRQRLTTDPHTVGHRVEIVDTATHWPSTYLLPDVTLARGWERQTDESRNPAFYTPSLTSQVYRRFLERSAVGVVVVARGVPLDYAATSEAALIATGIPYLHQVWSDAHWTMYDVASPAAMVAAPAQVVGQQDTGLVVRVPAAGDYDVRMQWSPYLVVAGGEVVRTADDQVSLQLPHAGRYRLHAMWRWP